MRFSTTAAITAISLLAGADAIISNITAPCTIAPSQPFNVTLNMEDYDQEVIDVAAAFGITPGSQYQQFLGTVIHTELLDPYEYNLNDPIAITMWLDANITSGPAVLSAVVFSLIGANAEPYTSYYNVSVTIGTNMSSETVTSDNQY